MPFLVTTFCDRNSSTFAHHGRWKNFFKRYVVDKAISITRGDRVVAVEAAIRSKRRRAPRLSLDDGPTPGVAATVGTLGADARRLTVIETKGPIS